MKLMAVLFVAFRGGGAWSVRTVCDLWCWLEGLACSDDCTFLGLSCCFRRRPGRTNIASPVIASSLWG